MTEILFLSVFVFTFGIVLLNMISYLALIVSGTVILHGPMFFDPTINGIFYPCFFFQIWFWTTQLNII